MFYATCINNLAATLEAMGLYDQAMKKSGPTPLTLRICVLNRGCMGVYWGVVGGGRERTRERERESE